MQLDFQKILQIVQTVGSAAPGFKQLFDEVVSLFAPHEQAELQEALVAAMAKSDALHSELQDLTKS